MKTMFQIKPNDMAQVYQTGEYPEGWHKPGTFEHRVNATGYMMESYVPVLPKIVYERIHDDALLPMYASEGDSGMDVYSPVNVLVRPQETVKVGIGFKIGIPRHPLHDLGYRWEVQSRPRSGLNLRTELVVKPGTIDNFFTGEPGVIVKNDTQVSYELEKDKVSVSSERVVEDVTLDAEYVGYVNDLTGRMVKTQELFNLGMDEYRNFPKGTLLIRKGDRIAQFVVCQVVRPLEVVEGKVDESMSRGGGFGSTGVQR